MRIDAATSVAPNRAFAGDEDLDALAVDERSSSDVDAIPLKEGPPETNKVTAGRPSRTTSPTVPAEQPGFQPMSVLA
jgi:hypothetical protein